MKKKRQCIQGGEKKENMKEYERKWESGKVMKEDDDENRNIEI